jgi:hypothetical protein
MGLFLANLVYVRKRAWGNFDLIGQKKKKKTKKTTLAKLSH